MTQTRPLRLTLGPLLHNWPAERRLDFYRAIAAEAPVDTVVLGEIVCAKRSPFVAEATLEAARLLEAAGKTVVFSTLALPVQPRERAEMRALCAQAETGVPVEANEAGALALLADRPHRVGPFFNTYNGETLRVLAGQGATTVCLPWELTVADIATIAAVARDAAVEIEVPAFGAVPLAISARCYHARAHGLSKDGCQYVCGEDPAGMPVATLDGQDFLRVNGTQTLSGAALVLVREAPALAQAGVTALRLMPEDVDMVAVSRAYRDLLDGRRDAAAVERDLHKCLGRLRPANGYLYGVAGDSWRDQGATA
jgi:collagenase-like PrtC family protease